MSHPRRDPEWVPVMRQGETDEVGSCKVSSHPLQCNHYVWRAGRHDSGTVARAVVPAAGSQAVLNFESRNEAEDHGDGADSAELSARGQRQQHGKSGVGLS